MYRFTAQAVLDNVNDFRKEAMEITKEAAQAAKRGEKRIDILNTMDTGFARVNELFASKGSVIEELTAVQKALRGLPIVQLHVPTVVLVSECMTGRL